MAALVGTTSAEGECLHGRRTEVRRKADGKSVCPVSPLMAIVALMKVNGVHTSVNAARRSACATSLLEM